MSLREPAFKEAETVQLAPDALVFINGSDTIRDDNGNVYELRNDVTDINTSLNVDGSGTANFTISIPDYSIKRVNGRLKGLKLMSEIEIYFKGRFPKQRTDGSLVYPYYPSFWGVIINLAESFSDGVHTVNVSCADILRWWQIVTVNINPAVITLVEADLLNKGIKDPNSYQTNNLTIFQTKFARLNVGEIFVQLSKIAVDNLVPLKNSFDAAFGTSDKINSDLRQSVQGNEDLMNYWNERFKQIGRGLRIYGIDSKTVKEETTTTPFIQNGKDFTVTDTVIRFKYDIDALSGVFPYNLEVQAPNALESVMKSKMDIANEIKEIIQWEFYMDVNGELILKPPFYNMNVKTNDSSVIKDLDIINWNFNASEAEVITRVEVTGQWVNQQSAGTGQAGQMIKGIWIDWNLAKRYGMRVATRTCIWLNTKEKCLVYAQGELAKLNTLLRQGSITILGRPELRLGYPVYIESRDAFYYVKTIDHSFAFGSSFQTTLTLVGERRKMYDETGQLIKWGVLRNAVALKDTSVSTEGNSIAEDSKNYMDDLYLKCVPSKKTSPTVTEAGFLGLNENIISSKFGDWELTSDVELPTNADFTTQYQVTDGEGYELIVPFRYGLGLSFSDTSTIKETKQTSAQQARDLNPEQFRLIANPNNTALTLDSEDASMLSMFDYSLSTKAEKASQVDPTK